MDPDAFVDDAPGEVEMVDGVFAYSPDPLPPQLTATHEYVELNGDAMHAIGQLSVLESWLDSPEIVLSPLIHREAADSTNIETITRVTLSDLYRRESGVDPSETETERADIGEAANYVEAITTGIERVESGADIDRDLLCDLHEILLRGVRGEQSRPGEFRDDLVGIGEPGESLQDARFVPTPPASVPYALRSLLQYIRSGPTYAPLIDIALIHYQFETIHPFWDGNSRLGRLLVMLVLYDWEVIPGPYLYPSAYFNANRDAYLDKLFTVSRDGAWEQWITFFLTAMAEQGREAYAVTQDLLTLRERYREQYQHDGVVIREVLDFIIEQPYCTEPQAVDTLNRSQPAVNSAIRQLWDDGVIEETTGQQRNRRYEAPEVLDIVEPYNM